MKSDFCRAASAAALAFAAAATVQGAGFSMYETSARSVAMGGATMGQYNDASAVYANPALLSQAEANGFLIGYSLVNPGMKLGVLEEGGRKNYTPKDQWFPPPFFYISYRLDDDFTLGFGEYSPYGVGIKHSPDWPGRFNSVETEISTYNFNPNLSYKVSDALSLAVGFDVMYCDVTLTRNIPTIDRELVNEADGIGYGFNAALALKATDTLGLGLVYRSKMREPLEGEATVKGLPGKYDIWEDLDLPQSISLGVNYSGIERWKLGSIVTWTDYCCFKDITIHFDPALLGQIPESKTETQWGDCWRFGLGAEYELSEFASVALGYVYDMDPIKLGKGGYMLPAGDRHIVSIGLTTKLTEKWKMGITYARVILHDEHIDARPANGVYDTDFIDGYSNVVSFDLSTTF